MAAYATGLIAGRYSVATAMGKSPEKDSASLSEAADRLLTSREASMFLTWKKDPKSALPSPDWRRLRTSITGSPASRRRWEQFVPALQLLYGDRERLSAEHCKGWAEKYPDAMPLLVAARKMHRARHYARGAGSSSSARLDYLELLACRKLMSEIGAQRIKASSRMKQINKYAADKEGELLRRISKLNVTDAPSSRESATKVSEARDSAYSKLTKTRTQRIADAAMVKKQNIELTSLETALRVRIAALEERLDAARRSAPSSSGRSRSRR
ncbi:Rabphilin-3A [Gracilaria domingensis]|nr:Rabphilin-3A [Gracilaria domingensis]